jgi:hypothetical protein
MPLHRLCGSEQCSRCQELYETRIALIQRFVAMAVMFHQKMGKHVLSSSILVCLAIARSAVKLQRSALLARGEQWTDILVNIFEALGTMPGEAFVTYIDRIKDDCNMMDPRVDEDCIMAMSESKCRTMKQEGKYNVPSKADVKIIALSAEEFECMQSLNTTLQAQLASQRDNHTGRGDQGRRGVR